MKLTVFRALLCLWLITLMNPAFGAAQAGSGLRLPPEVNLEQAQRDGQALVSDLLSRMPEPSLRTNTLRIRDATGSQREVPVKFMVLLTDTNWISAYETLIPPGSPGYSKLVVFSNSDRPNVYHFTDRKGTRTLKSNEAMVSFAGSDFWVADLGLEFLHWPKQFLLRKELRKGQSCDVLESVNPNPVRGAYSRVVSWIDIDTGGIVHADAYDASDKLLKFFEPSELQKVEGRMQVKEIEMRNRQERTRSWVTFDLRS